MKSAKYGTTARVQARGAIGVRWPRVCPWRGCGVLLENGRERRRHVDEHARKKVAGWPPQAPRRRGRDYAQVPSLIAVPGY